MSTGTASSPNAFYRGMFERRDRATLELVAEAKRFIECFYGDAKWRDALRAEPDTATSLFAAKGLRISPESVRSRWDPALSEDLLRQQPAGDREDALRAWQGWNADLAGLRDLLRAAADTDGVNPAFDRWRTRQARRMTHELDPNTVASIPNALAAYELSRGCSVGCWFCGVSAERFQGHMPYDADSAVLWRGMLQTMVDRFGRAAASGFCYWGSDPSDNPDYLRFSDDHLAVTGGRPQITTAAPFKSPALLEAMLDPDPGARHAPDRISVLTLRTLDQLHRSIDAQSMLHIDLVMHMKGSLMPKASAGRRRSSPRREEGPALAPVEQGTIACVVGFLVNLPERRVKLVAPCRADDANPDGYRVFAEERFGDAASYAAAIDALLADHVRESPRPDVALRFHPALDVAMEGGQLRIRSFSQEGRFPPFAFVPRLVDLVEARRHSIDELLGILSGEFPTQGIAIGAVVQDMFEHGLLDETGSADPQGKVLVHA